MKSNIVFVIISLALALWVVSVATSMKHPQNKEVGGISKSGALDCENAGQAAVPYSESDRQESKNLEIARGFADWWAQKAFDYDPATAAASQNEASQWLGAKAKDKFALIFWRAGHLISMNDLIFEAQSGPALRLPNGNIQVFLTCKYSYCEPVKRVHRCKIFLQVFKDSQGYQSIVDCGIFGDPDGEFLNRFLLNTSAVRSQPSAP